VQIMLDTSPDFAEAVARRVAELLAAQAQTGSPWLNAEEAAAYLRAPLSRIRKLTMTGDLPHAKDGRRVLYHRDELDSFLRSGGATSP